MDLFSLLQEVKDLLNKIEYEGRDEHLHHMKKCPCCGTFGPGQFGCKGKHSDDCNLNNIKNDLTNVLSEFSMHSENMWIKYDTGQVGYNQPLLLDGVDKSLKTILVSPTHTTKSQ